VLPADGNETADTLNLLEQEQTCAACPLMEQCLSPNQKHGRTVTRNDYEPEYEILRQRKRTEKDAAVKSEYPRVERRLGELVNRHGGRPECGFRS